VNTREIERIRETVETMPLFSSHEHYFEIDTGGLVGMNTLIANSYLDAEWTFLEPGATPQSHGLFLSQLRAKSYLRWFCKSLRVLYDMEEELSAENWESYGSRIDEKRRESGFLNSIYRDFCRYEAVVQDAYWSPGSLPAGMEFFYAAFRINSFLYSYSMDSEDHNGNNARKLYGFNTDDIDEYVSIMEGIILKQVDGGCVALKSALAYDRPISFDRVDKREAGRILKKGSRLVEKEVTAFGDYIFHEICRIAQDHGIPFQIHTGLGLLRGSDPMNLEPVIRTYPGIRFVLFHGGYPWYHSIGGLLHNYPNVYADLVWLPLISPTAATSALHEWLEVANSIHRIAWGSDCKTPEESYGASLAFRHVLATVLQQKVEDLYLDIEDALDIARLIASGNARALYLG